VNRSDVTLAAPSPAEVEAACAAAVRAANRRCRLRLLAWPPAGLGACLKEALGGAEGRRDWLGGRAEEVAETRSTLSLAWWRDFAGWPHVRVVARRVVCRRAADATPFGPSGDRPALMTVYPDRVSLLEEGGRRDDLALCACGVWGPPRALGWMGPMCGPCHDRQERGEPLPSVQWGLPRELHRHVLSADGRALAHINGQTVTAWRTDDGYVLGSMPTGADTSFWAVHGSGRVVLSWPFARPPRIAVWDVPASKEVAARKLVSPWAFGARFSPDGSAVVLLGAGLFEVWRLNRRPAPVEMRPEDREQRVTDANVSSDGRLLAAAGALLRVWETGTGREVSRAVFERGLSSPRFVGDRLLLLQVEATASGSAPATVLWDVARAEERRRLRGPSEQPGLTPDGGELFGRLGGSHGGLEGAGAWDVPTGKLRGQIEWVAEAFDLIELLPDGRLLTVALDRTVRVWPAEALLGGGARSG
jgi:hypothetical protein